VFGKHLAGSSSAAFKVYLAAKGEIEELRQALGAKEKNRAFSVSSVPICLERRLVHEAAHGRSLAPGDVRRH